MCYNIQKAHICAYQEHLGGLTMMESLICETPLITTNSGGITEYVTENMAMILEKNKSKVLLFGVIILFVAIPIAYVCFIMMYGVIWMIAEIFLSDGNSALIPIVTSIPNVFCSLYKEYLSSIIFSVLFCFKLSLFIFHSLPMANVQ
jgi:hypothetical protein